MIYSAVALIALGLASSASASSLRADPVAAGLASLSRFSIGDRMVRDFNEYVSTPITTTDAKAQGWVPLGSMEECIGGLGVPWAESSSGADEHHPTILYFTPFGQISAIGVRIMGNVKQNLIDRGFFLSGGSDEAFISVSFRSMNDSCSAVQLGTPLGDRLVINGGENGIKYELPLTASEAEAAGWVKGACFAGMGTHYFLDLANAGSMSWKAANMVPIVTMYDMESDGATGAINAFFFASSDVQQSIFPPNRNEWDRIPLHNYLMCKNWCDSSCTFSDTSFWSTYHVYLHDPKTVTCHGGCTLSCCGN